MKKYFKNQIKIWVGSLLLFGLHKLILLQFLSFPLDIELYYIFLALMNTCLGIIILQLIKNSGALGSIINSFIRIVISGIFLYLIMQPEDTETKKTIVINFIVPYLYFLFAEKALSIDKNQKEFIKKEFLGLKK